MKNKEELEQKYKEMLKDRDKLKKWLDNPPDETCNGMIGISDKMHDYNAQCSMIDLMEWVLDIKTYNQNKDE